MWLKYELKYLPMSGNYQAVTPFKKVIVFEDDVKESEDSCSGLFNINVFNTIAFDGAGDFYIHCTIATFTSNILHVVIPE
jgi:hypothetical protein